MSKNTTGTVVGYITSVSSNNTRFCLTNFHLPPEKLGKTRRAWYKLDGETDYKMLRVAYLL